MTNLFKKAAVFGDVHFGKKNNDRQFNVDCENYIKWFVKEAKAFGADTVIFLGDWHDNRHTIHVSTLNYSMSNFARINEAFENSYFLIGNHDLFYKEKRELSSVVIGQMFPNIKFIDEILEVGGVAFFPWLVGEDWKQVEPIADRNSYIFGHFELPNFLMNAKVEMPNHGGLNATHFAGVDHMAFSGHFHTRQQKDKVCYVGSPFPHDFADAWDDDRGMMLLEWGEEPKFKNWTEGPQYRTANLSELLEDPFELLNERSYARISSDIDITYEELSFIRSVFQSQFGPRKLDLTPFSNRREEQNFADEKIKFQSVDQIIIEGLKNIDSLMMDKAKLIEIYRSLN